MFFFLDKIKKNFFTLDDREKVRRKHNTAYDLKKM